MTRRVLLALCCLAACAATPKIPAPSPDLADCVTRCGLRVITHVGRCTAAQNMESRLLAAVTWDTKIPAADFCAAEAGWIVVVHEHTTADSDACYGSAWWQSSICVDGYTYSALRMVAAGDEDWEHNALAHELFHVYNYSAKGVVGHCGWLEQGIKTAIKDTTGVRDNSPPEESCDWPDAGD